MAAACLASFAILASGLALYGLLYGLDWYKNRKQNSRKSTKKLEKEYYTIKEPLAEQMA